MERTAKLKTITETLLSPVLDYTAVRDACVALAAFFCEVSGFDMDARENQEHIHTNAGLAVSPYTAAYCIMDMMRTRNFLQGIKEAIDTKLKDNPGKPVVVFYAGTGPFATLVVPLTTVFSPSQLQLVLMDINPISIECLKKIIGQLALQPYIIDVMEADATSYIIPEGQQPEILVSETMKNALAKEPQVNIVANLLPQCSKNPALIPQCIRINFCSLGNWENYQLTVNHIATLLELNGESIFKIAGGNGPAVFAEGLPVAAGEAKEFALSTFIHIYGSHTLRQSESDLTLPHRLKEKPENENEIWLFRYNRQGEPGLYIERTTADK